MEINPYGSHLPILEHLFNVNPVRDILEVGTGDYSTAFFLSLGVKLTSVEQVKEWYETIKEKYPHIQYYEHLDFIAAPENRLKTWDLVFIDGTIDSRLEFVQWAQYHTSIIVIHDSEAQCYRYDKINLPEWYVYEFDKYQPQTRVYSKYPIFW